MLYRIQIILRIFLMKRAYFTIQPHRLAKTSEKNFKITPQITPRGEVIV